MNTYAFIRLRAFLYSFALGLQFVGMAPGPAQAIPSFPSSDNRLPNPDRPYEMVDGPVHYDSTPDFALYDLEFVPSNPSQLDVPTRNPDGSSEFDSTFNITYKAVVSFSTQPPQTVSGIGRARARGFAAADAVHSPSDLIWPNPQVYDAELVELNLFSLSLIPEIMFRESPEVRSSGVIIREDTCPVCMRPFQIWDISSYFEIATEITFNGGVTWTPAQNAIHVEQAPDGFPSGDYNKDYVVDTGDYVEWRGTLRQVGAGLAADGDWSGQVDAGDFEVWRQNFGHKSTSSTSANGTVPEPASVVALILGITGILSRQLRVRSQRMVTNGLPTRSVLQ
jgi:hypothetical protein